MVLAQRVVVAKEAATVRLRCEKRQRLDEKEKNRFEGQSLRRSRPQKTWGLGLECF
jgi:hypothetical protein